MKFTGAGAKYFPSLSAYGFDGRSFLQLFCIVKFSDLNILRDGFRLQSTNLALLECNKSHLMVFLVTNGAKPTERMTNVKGWITHD